MAVILEKWHETERRVVLLKLIFWIQAFFFPKWLASLSYVYCGLSWTVNAQLWATMHANIWIKSPVLLLPRELSDLVLTPSSFRSKGSCINPVGCIKPSLSCLHGGFPVELEGQMSAFNPCLHEVLGHDSSQLLGWVGWAWWYLEGSALWPLALPLLWHICSRFLSPAHPQLASFPSLLFAKNVPVPEQRN